MIAEHRPNEIEYGNRVKMGRSGSYKIQASCVVQKQTSILTVTLHNVS
jgi:hypothetical protein